MLDKKKKFLEQHTKEFKDLLQQLNIKVEILINGLGVYALTAEQAKKLKESPWVRLLDGYSPISI